MKRIFLVFVLILSLMTLKISSFANTIPEPPTVDGYPYWVIYIGQDQYTGKWNVLHCSLSKEVQKISNSGDKIAVRNGLLYKYIEDQQRWDRYVSHGGTGYEYFGMQKVLAANHVLTYENGEIYLGDYQIITNDISANVNIVLPRDGFVDNVEIFQISVITEFNRYLTDEEISKLTIEVKLNGESVEGEKGITYNRMNRTKLYSVNELAFYIEVPVGQNEVEVSYYYENNLIGSDKVTFTRLSGFVDEDGDGLDDRTGQPPSPRYRDKEEIPYDTDDIGGNVYTVIKNAYNSFSTVFAFLGQVFSMFPIQIVILSTAFIGLLIVLRILGR